jgi:hypothetical protein
MKLFQVVVLLFASAPAWTAEIYTFSLLPGSGDVAGAPGDTIGWGYSIENQSATDWLVTTSVDPGAFQSGTSNLIFDFPIVAPGSSVTERFDADALTGLMAFTWDASVPRGTVESGRFLLNAEWWNGDPLAGGQFAFAASPLSASYRATVIPEPGTFALIGLALAAAGAISVRRRQRPGTQNSHVTKTDRLSEVDIQGGRRGRWLRRIAG